MVTLHCGRPHSGIFSRPRYKCSTYEGATFFTRRYGDVTPEKHAHWGTFGIRPLVYQGFPLLFTFTLLHPQFCILNHPMYNVTPHKTATFCSQLYGSNNHIKHEPRGTIGIRPYVYKGFPFIWSLLHCVRPRFGIFNRPRYNVPPHKGATLLSRHCGSVTSTKHAHWETFGIRTRVYQGFLLIG